MAHGGSADINAQTMKLLIRDSGLTAPMNASPGEMRLWLKKNGFTEAFAAKRAGQQVSMSKPRAAPRAAPAASAPKKTAGHRGGRVGRSGSMVAAANAAMAPAAGDHALAQGGAALGAQDVGGANYYADAIDGFKKQHAAQQK